MKPTIAELERLLEEQGSEAIEILPSGEIRVKGGALIDPVTRKLVNLALPE